jgi:hypothetical protein
MTRCTHAYDNRRDPDRLICAIGLFKGQPYPSDCESCDQYSGPSRGLGDTVAKALKVTGVEKIVKKVKGDCGCGKRRASLNKAFPSKDKSDA